MKLVSTQYACDWCQEEVKPGPDLLLTADELAVCVSCNGRPVWFSLGGDGAGGNRHICPGCLQRHLKGIAAKEKP